MATKQRVDLQGMRAVAVLLVALNHANIPFLKGGYVGVDVFFVLSGYFITGLLVREALDGDDPRGMISLSGFYARRARRILPAATLTLAVTSVAVYIVYDIHRANFIQTKPTLLDALASALFFANIHFAATATNYFAQAASTFPSPVQHFWSLSVEEQFYVIWPSLLAAVFLVCRWRRATLDRRAAIRSAGAVVAIACIASLLWSIHDTAVNPQGAYFSTFARVWELGCGAGLALFVASARSFPSWLCMALGWGGAAAIVAAAVLYSNATAFPGAAALLPVLGTGSVILSGLVPQRAGVGRVLALRPFTYIGDRSYTFYLWHYPILIVVWQAAGHTLSVPVNVGLLAGAFALSVLTFQFYENPLRFAHWLRGWRTAAMLPISLATSVTAIMIPLLAFQGSLAASASAASRAHVKPLIAARGETHPTNLSDASPLPQALAAAQAAVTGATLPKAIVPSMAVLEQENKLISYDVPKGCQPSFGSGSSSNICRLGDPTAKRVVVVFGDSHAGMWVPALLHAARKQHFALVPIDKPGCFVNREHTNLPGWPCATWYSWAIKQVQSLHPVATIVTYELGGELLAHPRAAVSDVRHVLSAVPNGVLLADPPGQSQQPATCITQPNATMRSCSTPESPFYPRLMQDLANMAQHTHHVAMPTIQWFCANKICPMVIDHTLTTRDGDHLTMQYSTDLGPLMSDELAPILSHSKPA